MWSLVHLSSSCHASTASRNLRVYVLFVADVGVLDVLLGDGGAALHDGACAQVEHHGARDALEVDAVVLVEALVLDGHRGVLHDLGDLVAGHEDAVLGPVQLGDELTVTVVDGGVDGVAPLLELVERRQVAGDGEDGAGGCAERGDGDEQHDEARDLEPQVPGACRAASGCGVADARGAPRSPGRSGTGCTQP